jgi:hypothetical protein
MNHRQKSPLVVFDLDSTLFNVSTRTQKIIFDFCSTPEFLKKYSAEIASLKMIQVLAKDWGLREPLERHAIRGTIGFFEDLRLYWRHHFFSNEYLRYDIPYEGALEYVNSLSEAGLQVIYMTGRDRPHMFDGTVASLQQHGFPLKNADASLYMKPARGSAEDEDFKSTMFAELKKHHSLIYFFENEPVILNKVKAVHPEIKMIFMDTVHCGRETAPPGLPSIPGKFEVSLL